MRVVFCYTNFVTVPDLQGIVVEHDASEDSSASFQASLRNASNRSL